MFFQCVQPHFHRKRWQLIASHYSSTFIALLVAEWICIFEVWICEGKYPRLPKGVGARMLREKVVRRVPNVAALVTAVAPSLMAKEQEGKLMERPFGDTVRNQTDECAVYTKIESHFAPPPPRPPCPQPRPLSISQDEILLFFIPMKFIIPRWLLIIWSRLTMNRQNSDRQRMCSKGLRFFSLAADDEITVLSGKKKKEFSLWGS